MSRKIALLIDKNTFYQLFAPLIEETLKRGYEVFCFHDGACANNGAKGYMYPTLDDVPEFINGNPAIRYYHGTNEFTESIRSLEIEVVVSINYRRPHFKLHEQAKRYGVKWVAIQYAFDMIPESDLIDYPDRFFFFSPIWYELARTFKRSDQKQLMGTGVRFCGFPELDQRTIIDPAQVRAELGIPEGKPVVLYLSFQYRMLANQLYSRYIFTENNPIMKLVACLRYPKYFNHILKGYNNENVFKSIKQFCERNDAYLLINGRQKSPIPHYIKGDKTVIGTSFYPADILKLLSVSDICFNFWSTVVTECVPMNVSNVCIAPELDDFSNKNNGINEHSIFNHVLNICPDLFNSEGVTRMMSIKDAIQKLPNMNFNEFTLNPQKQAQWIKKFLTSSDTKCSERIVNEIESLLRKNL